MKKWERPVPNHQLADSEAAEGAHVVTEDNPFLKEFGGRRITVPQRQAEPVPDEGRPIRLPGTREIREKRQAWDDLKGIDQ